MAKAEVLSVRVPPDYGIYDEFKQKGIPVVTDMKDEPWDVQEFARRDMDGYNISVLQSSRRNLAQ